MTLKVYDVLGNEVATLVDEFRPAGNYEVEFKCAVLSCDGKWGLFLSVKSGTRFYSN